MNMIGKRKILEGLRCFFESLLYEEFIKFRKLCNDSININNSDGDNILIINFNKSGPLKKENNIYTTNYYMDFLYKEKQISGFFKLLLCKTMVDGICKSYIMYWNTDSNTMIKFEGDIHDFCYRVTNNIYFRIGQGVIKLNTSFMEMEISRV